MLHSFWATLYTLRKKRFFGCPTGGTFTGSLNGSKWVFRTFLGSLESFLVTYGTFLGSWTCKEPFWEPFFQKVLNTGQKYGTKRVPSCTFFSKSVIWSTSRSFFSSRDNRLARLLWDGFTWRHEHTIWYRSKLYAHLIGSCVRNSILRTT